MAKPTAPLLSFGASGQIAKTMVYSRWKGRSYVRRHVIPNNPQSSEQTLTRNTFTFLQNVYKFAPALVTAPWTAYSTGKVLTNRNAFAKFNISNLRSETDLDNLTLSPGALGGPPPASQVVTPGSGSLSVAITAPATTPVGWTLYSMVTAIIRDQDPQSGILYVVTAAEDLTSTYTNVFSSLGAHLWQVRSWAKWTRPDGTTAYSPDIATTASSS